MKNPGIISFKLVLTLTLLLACTLPLLSWDSGFIGLTVPAKTEAPLMVDIDIAHKLGSLLPPGGINARLGLGTAFLHHFRIAGEYATGPGIWNFQASAWLPLSTFHAGAAYTLVVGRDSLTGDAYVAQAVDLFGRASFFADRLVTVLNLQFDTYLLRLNGGLGLSLAVIGPVHITAEGYLSPPFTGGDSLAWGWNSGVLLTTYGHQFLLFAGSGINSGMKEILAEQSDRSFKVGFVIRRKLDVYF